MLQDPHQATGGPPNDALIDRTIRFWRPRMRQDISREDARQIVELVTGFFDVLMEWERVSTTAANDHRVASSITVKSPEAQSSTGPKGQE